VRIATDGTQVLQLALSERVDLVVLDLGLPELARPSSIASSGSRLEITAPLMNSA